MENEQKVENMHVKLESWVDEWREPAQACPYNMNLKVYLSVPGIKEISSNSVLRAKHNQKKHCPLDKVST